MAEPKAKTLIQQLGFFDKDLKTGTHDQIMFWLHENARSVINRLFYSDWPTPLLDRLIQDTKNEIDQVIPRLKSRLKHSEGEQKLLCSLESWSGLPEPPTRSPFEIERLEWEKPVEQTGYSNNKFTIGFIDMAITYSYQDIRISGIPRNPNNRLDLSAYSFPKWSTEEHYSTIYVEVKCKISSAGELLRQLNLYRSYRPGTYLVVSPDNRFEDILGSQGIRFISPFT